MTMVRRFIKSVLICLCLGLLAPVYGRAEVTKSPHLEVELMADADAVSQDGDIWIAIRHKPNAGWHTYWQNPGDTGLAPQIDWLLPQGVSVGAIHWPSPQQIPYQGLINYGYGHQTYLLLKLHNGSALKDGVLPLKARINFLVCADICVPESVDVALDLKVGKASKTGILSKAMSSLPKPITSLGKVQIKGDVALISFARNKAASGDEKFDFEHPAGAYLYPETGSLFAATKAQDIDLGSQGFTLKLKVLKPLDDARLYGVIKFKSGRAYRVGLVAGVADTGTSGLGAPTLAKSAVSVSGLLAIMGAAFIGGLILNLMPCVFPILSIKALSLSRLALSQDKEHAKSVRLSSLIYGLGVIISFIGLSLGLNLLVGLGAGLGWGFQLQSPYVTAGLSLLMLLVGLNMSGLFDIGQGLQNISGQNLARQDLGQRRPLISAFMTGVLAVMVAAPCTAPFMATALGVAISQGGLVSLAIFLALGLGFAAPIVVISYMITLSPNLARLMPKPGAWMDRLKTFLALPMYLAMIWMMWIFAQQASLLALVILLSAACLLSLGVSRLGLPKLLKACLVVLSLIMAFTAAQQAKNLDSKAAISQGIDIPHEKFSTQRIAQLRAQNIPVFVDLTAAWCVTCKVNERLILATPQFKKMLADTHTVYMVGDWTNQDAQIALYLSQFGRSGVPLYVYYPKGLAEPKILPQILSLKILDENLHAKK